MASELSSDQLRRLARLGAAARLEELRREEAAIRRTFPEIGQVVRRGPGRPPKAAVAAGRPAKRRPRMSAAARKAVSVRMKKYWAVRRKAKAAGR